MSDLISIILATELFHSHSACSHSLLALLFFNSPYDNALHVTRLTIIFLFWDLVFSLWRFLSSGCSVSTLLDTSGTDTLTSKPHLDPVVNHLPLYLYRTFLVRAIYLVF